MAGIGARHWLVAGVVISGMVAATVGLTMLYLWFLGCIFGSTGCGQYGATAVLVIAVLAGAVAGLVLAARPTSHTVARSPITIAAFGIGLLGYASYGLVRQRLTPAIDYSSMDREILAPVSLFGSAFFLLVLAAAVCLLVGAVESARWHRIFLAPAIAVAVSGAVLLAMGPITLGDARRPASPADQVQHVRVTDSTVSVQPGELATGLVDLELTWPSYDSATTLALVGPLEDEHIAALEAGVIDWRGTYLLKSREPGSTGLLWSGPPNPEGYLDRVRLSPGRYAWFTMVHHSAPINSSSSAMTSVLVLGAWATFVVE